LGVVDVVSRPWLATRKTHRSAGNSPPAYRCTRPPGLDAVGRTVAERHGDQRGPPPKVRPAPSRKLERRAGVLAALRAECGTDCECRAKENLLHERPLFVSLDSEPLLAPWRLGPDASPRPGVDFCRVCREQPTGRRAKFTRGWPTCSRRSSQRLVNETSRRLGAEVHRGDQRVAFDEVSRATAGRPSARRSEPVRSYNRHDGDERGCPWKVDSRFVHETTGSPPTSACGQQHCGLHLPVGSGRSEAPPASFLRAWANALQPARATVSAVLRGLEQDEADRSRARNGIEPPTPPAARVGNTKVATNSTGDQRPRRAPARM